MTRGFAKPGGMERALKSWEKGPRGEGCTYSRSRSDYGTLPSPPLAPQPDQLSATIPGPLFPMTQAAVTHVPSTLSFRRYRHLPGGGVAVLSDRAWRVDSLTYAGGFDNRIENAVFTAVREETAALCTVMRCDPFSNPRDQNLIISPIGDPLPRKSVGHRMHARTHACMHASRRRGLVRLTSAAAVGGEHRSRLTASRLGLEQKLHAAIGGESRGFRRRSFQTP